MHTMHIKALFAACAVAFATSGMAAETGKGDQGPNNKAGAGSSMGASGSAGTSGGTSGGGTGMGKSSASSETRAMAKKDYDAAMAKCKDMKGAERSTCRKDAKSARDAAMGKNTSAAAPASAGSMSGMKDGGKTGSAAPSAQGTASGSTSSTTAPTKGDSMPSGAKPDSKASSNKP